MEKPQVNTQSDNIIGIKDGCLEVPNEPIIPYIRGDGIGIDITPVTLSVINSGIKKVYNGDKKIQWKKVLAGDQAARIKEPADQDFPEDMVDIQRLFLPDETLEAIKIHKVALKGPLTTPVGSGFRSLNVAIRQALDLYACVRPVKWIKGTPTPLKNPELVDIVIFRENTEDVYAGIEWPYDSIQASKVRHFLNTEMDCNLPDDSAIGIKPVSINRSKRLVRAAIQYAIDNNRKSVTLVHKGNIMKYTEGAFREWGYEVATQEFRSETVTEKEYGALFYKDKYPEKTDGEIMHMLREEGYPGYDKDYLRKLEEIYPTHGNGNLGSRIIVKDRIADQMFQQLLLRPGEYDVIATLNLNGDYLSDSCAAEVGGLGLAPGANYNFETGVAVFEPTHGTAPKYAGLDKVNPSSMILSAVMMLRYLGWNRAADIVEKALNRTIENETVTYDLHRQMEGATLVSTSEFGKEIITNMF
jgi:isocitrate dehydrogenase